MEKQSRQHLIKEAAKRGDIATLRRLHSQSQNGEMPPSVTLWATSGGHLDCLRFLHEELKIPFASGVAMKACYRGHLDCLQYIHRKSELPILDVFCAHYAAAGGHLECLKYVCKYISLLKSNADDLSQVITYAATHGHTSCLEYALSIDIKPSKFATGIAAECGQYDCLALLHRHGAPMTLPFSFAPNMSKKEITRILLYYFDNRCSLESCKEKVDRLSLEFEIEKYLGPALLERWKNEDYNTYNVKPAKKDVELP